MTQLPLWTSYEWPEYAVEQDTDSSMVSSPDDDDDYYDEECSNMRDKWVKEQGESVYKRDEKVVKRQKYHRNSDECVNERGPCLNMNTRMSSGYFSGDEFRSCPNNQFSISKFLSTQRHEHEDAIDDFNSMYKKIDLVDHCCSSQFSQINIHLDKGIDGSKSYELIEDLDNNQNNNSLLLNHR